MMAFVHRALYPCKDSRHIRMGSYVFHTWFFTIIHTHTSIRLGRYQNGPMLMYHVKYSVLM